MKIGLFVKQEVVSKENENSLISKIVSLSHEIDNKHPEIVFTIGGDGTLLKAIQKYLPIIDEVTFVPLNKGKLAYFSDFKVEDIEEILSSFSSFDKKSYPLLRGRFGNEEIYALNEIRIENPFKTLVREVYINDEYLETFRGNGLLVSSPIGSTAYNKSLSGAVISPSVSAIELSEIAPINNRLYSSLKSSLVLPNDAVISLKGDLSNVVIGYDHLVNTSAKGNELVITLSDKKANILKRKGHSYIKHLNETFVGK